ncbi:GNAT family N-acetyltransferase [Hankyongella ginsenosidimutans]|uniref:GNAT family N-acetyltransferase n=1 Tax=Hankyongella ginsenosidimutans TaxID=1763828 RepID=A0A4D7CAJ5_9SPHN|nr:GNAT family N-acetyltransferase [Hankyongella ginsenosidimutans]
MTLAPVGAEDPAFRDALQRAGLPVGDLADDDACYFALIAEGASIAFGGIAGIGADRLLRSIVVPAGSRRAGIGARIVAALEHEAKRAGVDRLWLLTTDASGFFDRLGWQTAERSTAPDAIRRCGQFASVCPASATLMARTL